MLDKIEDALKDFAAGKFVIVVDDEDRENEGDLVLATQFITPEAVNFIVKQARGMMCVCMTEERANELRLPPMVEDNTSLRGTGYTVTIDYIHDTTTGISCHDRAKTLKAIVNPDTKPADFARPGHIQPLRAKDGGVIERPGQTEAAVDLARLAGLYPSGIVCEIMNEDGTMMRRNDLRKFANLHGLRMISVADLIRHRVCKDRFVHERVRVNLPTKHGHFTLIHFEDALAHKDHLAIVKGLVPPKDGALIRIHSECLTGDVFGSARCDCGPQLDTALERIEAAGNGAVIYLRQEGRGIGLGAKLQAYRLQDQGLDTVQANIELGYEPDLRTYGAAIQIMRAWDLKRVRLMTNNPRKVEALKSYGIDVIERVPLVLIADENRHYLETKRDKLGHMIQLES